MSDDKTKIGGQDLDRIDVHEAHELRDWAEAFGVTPEKIRQALPPSATALKRCGTTSGQGNSLSSAVELRSPSKPKIQAIHQYRAFLTDRWR